MRVFGEAIQLTTGFHFLALGVTDEDEGVYATLCQFATILDMPKNTLEARMKVVGTNQRKLVANKTVLHGLRQLGGLTPTSRPSMVVMYPLIDYMVALENKIPCRDMEAIEEVRVKGVELQKAPPPLPPQQHHHPIATSNTPARQSVLQLLASAANALYVDDEEERDDQLALVPAGHSQLVAFSPINYQMGSPIILAKRGPGRPPRKDLHGRNELPRSSNQLPSTPSSYYRELRTAAPQSPLSARRALPTTIPTVHLSIVQMKERYGVPRDAMEPEMEAHVAAFKAWSKNPFQLDRSGPYARPIQTETWDSAHNVIRGYLGYVALYHKAGTFADAYSDANSFIRFVAYLRARGVRKGFINAHIKVAKKVNKYLDATMSKTDEDRRGYSIFHEWLVTLDNQINANMPDSAPRKAIPDCTRLHAWVDRLAEGAKQAILTDRPNRITLSTANTVQAAVIAMFVTGRHTAAPCRLSSIKSVIHPSFVGKLGACHDQDCQSPSTCAGNRFEVRTQTVQVTAPPQEEADDPLGSPRVAQERSVTERRVKFVIPHHKNERHNSIAGEGIAYDLPAQPNPLTRLLLIHMDEGRSVILEQSSAEQRTPYLFLNFQGRPLGHAKSTFTTYWRQLMDKTAPADIDRFPPSLARKSFVEWYTLEYGDEPEMWDGAADIMGNSTRKWQEVYNVSAKKRRMQTTLDKYSQRHSNVDESWEDEDLDLPAL